MKLPLQEKELLIKEIIMYGLIKIPELLEYAGSSMNLLWMFGSEFETDFWLSHISYPKDWMESHLHIFWKMTFLII